MGYLWLDVRSPKPIQSIGIRSQPSRTPFHELHQNHQIEAVSEGLLEQDHQAKRYKVLLCDIQQESLKETSPKLPHGKSKKRLRKSPKGENRKNANKP
jgi:hypothetical protein